jgi:hypothetical protein
MCSRLTGVPVASPAVALAPVPALVPAHERDAHAVTTDDAGRGR